MKGFETYTPSQEEIKKAEEMLTPEMDEQSKIREKNKIQREDPFWGGADLLSESDFERRPCTVEEKEALDRQLKKLAEVFKGADFFWQLDGALNISIYRGAYIGVHKDIDVSFDINEIEKVESFLGGKGFGLFLSLGGEKPRTYERIDGRACKERPNEHPMVFAIDEYGRIKHQENGFSIDTHIIRWNECGQPIYAGERTFPKEWLLPRQIEFEGNIINCSHPALVAFHKLFFNREYDTNDLKLLAESGALKQEDLLLMEKVFGEHFTYLEKIIREFAGRIFSKFFHNINEQEIFELLINDELVKAEDGNRESKEIVDSIAKELFKKRPSSVEETFKIIFNIAPHTSMKDKVKSKIELLYNNLPN